MLLFVIALEKSEMNERVCELAKESGITQYVAENNKYLERFAKFLILEAAAFVSGSAEVYNQAEQDACVRTSKGLMKHFGVEE
jgi:hypothetical protein